MTGPMVVLAVTLAAVAPRAAFDSLKSLAGEWEGQAGVKMEAAEKKPETPPQKVTYRVVSNGNVVMETLFGGTSHEMITMYHLDGEDLVLTHYCAAGNQPKMKLDTRTSTDRDLRFSFAGGTNITTEGFHMHEGRVILVDADHIESEWAGQQGGKPGHTAGFKLTRKK
jgi:hypothetical protein